MRAARLPVAALVLALLPACGGDGGGGGPLPPLDLAAGCNPLGAGSDCLLPYPSDVFLVEDPTLPSGRRVEIPDAALPTTRGGEPIDFLELHPADGFSHLPQLLFLPGAEIDEGPLVTYFDDVTGSLGPDSATVLVDAETGERILHLAEVDPLAADPARRAVFIRPLERLANERRYVVAVRGSRLRRADGQALPAPEAFRRLRDGEAAGDPVLEPLAARYEAEVFPVLDAAGVDRATLFLAWDFSTESLAHVTGDLARAMDLAREALAAGPAVTVTAVETEFPDGLLAARVRGTLTVPLVMASDRPGALLHRDGRGEVALNGLAEVPFTLQLPTTVTESSGPGRLVQYGHGFFGGRGEIEGSFVRGFGHDLAAPVMAVDWWGMSSPDADVVGADLLQDPSRTLRFTDRVHQGLVNQAALTLAAEALAALPETQVGAGAALDPSRVYWYGISQGHILGGTYLGVAPERLDRGVLSVGGAGVPFMMFRAGPFSRFLDLIRVHLPDPLDQRKFVTLSSTVFDRVDPITYAPWVVDSGRPLLQHTGLGDPQVPNVASFTHARALGLTQLVPAPEDVPGLPQSEGPLDRALVVFDFGIPEPRPGRLPVLPDGDNEVHEGVRRLDASVDQIDRFFAPDGQVVHTCDGACDPQ